MVRPHWRAGGLDAAARESQHAASREHYVLRLVLLSLWYLEFSFFSFFPPVMRKETCHVQQPFHLGSRVHSAMSGRKRMPVLAHVNVRILYAANRPSIYQEAKVPKKLVMPLQVEAPRPARSRRPRKRSYRMWRYSITNGNNSKVTQVQEGLRKSQDDTS